MDFTFRFMKQVPIIVSLLILISCGGGGGGGSAAPAATPPAPAFHNVTISWAANREHGVNTTGGGYTLAISGQSAINVPYVSGAAAPTSKVVSLYTGTYTATVTAYAALDASGGGSGSTSTASSTLSINVP